MRWMRALTLAMLVALVFVAVGCNTFRGLGKDVEKGGEKIQKVAGDGKS